jgi:hypothetical protein
MTNQPKALRDPRLVAQRRGMLHEPHVRDLTEFVEDLRRRRLGAEIPYFDPADGGIAARVLLLLQAPGAKATGSGFVSRDNPDETAANIWAMSREVGLNRTDCVIWNVCPWYVGVGGGNLDQIPPALEVGRPENRQRNRISCGTASGPTQTMASWSK